MFSQIEKKGKREKKKELLSAKKDPGGNQHGRNGLTYTASREKNTFFPGQWSLFPLCLSDNSIFRVRGSSPVRTLRTGRGQLVASSSSSLRNASLGNWDFSFPSSGRPLPCL